MFIRICSPLEQSQNAEMVFRRIDDGWNLDVATRFPNIFTEPEPCFAALETMMNSDERKARIEDARFENNGIHISELHDELRMHNFFPRLSGNIFQYGKINITRHRLILFLRWCVQEHNAL